MPVTPNFNIPYPDGTTPYTPVDGHFAAMAGAVDTALSTGLGGAPRVAYSDAERSTVFPAPVQGNTVVRPDRGYTEQYYALYDSGTNPSGATPAGWYPVYGSLPSARVTRSSTALTVSTATYTAMSTTNLWTEERLNNFSSFNGGWTIPSTGIYEVYANAYLLASGLTGALVGFTTQATPVAGTSQFLTFAVGGAVAGNAGVNVTTGPRKFAAGDKLTMWGLSAGANGALQTFPNISYWGVQYISPPVGS